MAVASAHVLPWILPWIAKKRMHRHSAHTGTDHLRVIKHGETYVRRGLEDYEKKFAGRKLNALNALQKTTKPKGFELVEKQALPARVS
jgi:hypothetical protein